MIKDTLIAILTAASLWAYTPDDPRFAASAALEKEMAELQQQISQRQRSLDRQAKSVQTFEKLIAIQLDLLSQIRQGNLHPVSLIGRRAEQFPHVIYSETFEPGFQAQDDQRCTSRLVNGQSGNYLEISKGMWPHHLDLPSICGRRIRVSCDCRLQGRPIANARHGAGGRVMFLEKTPDGGKWHGQNVNPGIQDWQTVSFDCQLGFDVMEGHLSLGVQDFEGSLQIRRLTVTILPSSSVGSDLWLF